MNIRKLLKDLLTAFGAQGFSFVCSCVTTLFVPKILGVEEYGYYQLFIFYSSYVSFFQLGLNDGVYLQHGGEGRDVIDRGLIRGEMRVGLCYQAFAAVIIAGYGLVCEDDAGRTLVILAAAAYLLLSNTTYFVSYVFQAMNETRIASYSTVVNRAVYIVPLLACIFLRVDDFFVYVCFYLLAQAVSLAYCLWEGREFLRARPPAPRAAVRETLRSMRLGIVLTVANVTGSLIMGMARLVIDSVWGLSAFGEVSLSLSIVNFALTFISQVAMVLFPALRTAGADRAREYYARIRDGLAVVLPAAMLLYAPLRALVGLWLPQYEESLIYLAFLFPVCLFEAQSNLTVITFLKVRCEPRTLLLMNVAALAVTAAAQGAAALLFGSAEAVVMASLIGVAFRYTVGTMYLGGVYGSRNVKAMGCMYADSLAFMAAAYFLPLWLGFVCCVGVLAIHLVVCRQEATALFGKLRRLSRPRKDER